MSGPPKAPDAGAAAAAALARSQMTVQERIQDANRPDWESFKRERIDGMAVGVEGKMAEYRQKLDREREEKLARGGSNINKSSKQKKKARAKKRKQKKDSTRKHKDRKSHRKRSHSSSSSSSSSSLLPPRPLP